MIIDPTNYMNNDPIRVEYANRSTEVASIIGLFKESSPIFGL